MKEGHIDIKVTKGDDISQKIKDFIHDKLSHEAFPFNREEVGAAERKMQSRAKRSLTDWRQLYSRNQNKIIPRHTVYPATADGQRIRCTMTGQCNRKRVYSSAVKSTGYQGERYIQTRQSRRERLSQAKRQSLVEFAFAQNIYQNYQLKDQHGVTASQRGLGFCVPKKLDNLRGDYCKIGQYLSNVKAEEEASRDEIDATEEYVKRLHQEDKTVKVRECNFVKIKEKHKIDNTRFFESLQLVNKGRKTLHVTNGGLRYYERK